MERIRLFRTAQIVLVLAALLLGLRWYETPAQTHETGSERMELHVVAPVVRTRGPWQEGTVLTEADAGIPTDVAPLWNLTVRHHASGIRVEHVDWLATVLIQQINSEGRAWWRVESPLPIEGSDGAATVRLDARALQERASKLLTEAKVPGRLDVIVRITEVVRVHREGGASEATRSATLTIQPQGDMTILLVDTETASYVSEVEKTPDFLIAALPLAAAGLEIGVRRTTGRAAALDLVRSVRVIPVRNLVIAKDVPFVSFGRLFEIARQSSAPVYQDDERGLLLMRGDMEVAARYPWLPPGWENRPAPSVVSENEPAFVAPKVERGPPDAG